MINTDSREFFEISMGPQPGNTFKARLLCIGDFLKRCLKFPLILIHKVVKTVIRFIGIFLAAFLVIVTLGSSRRSRELFIDRTVVFAKDLADWLLMPFALALCFLRLMLALFIHPNFYFNAL